KLEKVLGKPLTEEQKLNALYEHDKEKMGKKFKTGLVGGSLLTLGGSKIYSGYKQSKQQAEENQFGIPE
ncbi:MAG: hypothetical protein ACP5JE_05135, partial [Thermoplasmata archaeon]